MDELGWIFEFIGNEDMVCPIFNVLIDESWGLGSGQDWENGCRENIRL